MFPKIKVTVQRRTNYSDETLEQFCDIISQAQIQDFGLEGAKFGEGSGDRLGPQSGPGRSPGGGAPRKLLQFSDFRAQKSYIFMSKYLPPFSMKKEYMNKHYFLSF